MTLLAPPMFLLVGLIGCILVCASDVWCRKVFNGDVMLVVVSAAGWVATTAPSTIPARLFVATGVMSAGGVLWLLGWLGGGDAKLLAAAAIWTGPDATFQFLITTALAGGILTATIVLMHRAAHLLVRGQAGSTLIKAKHSLLARWPMRKPDPVLSGTVPYAPAIIAGLILSMVDKVI